VYLIACRSLDLEAEKRQAAFADRGLDPDDPDAAAPCAAGTRAEP
jgi:hypothetical protein